MTTGIELNHTQAMQAISHCMDHSDPVFLWGPPGCGKSQGIQELAENQGIECVDLRASQLEAVDIRGIPVPQYKDDKTEAVWALPEFLPKDSNWEGIVFLDELNTAIPIVLNSMYQLILDRQIGQYKLPDGARLVAAGNRMDDNGCTFEMPSPLANRFTHLEIAEITSDEWVRYAMDRGIRPEVTAYISNNPAALSNYEKLGQAVAFSTPRSWEKVSKLYNSNLPMEVQRAIYAGRVGQGLADDFLAYIELGQGLPNPKDVLTGKVKKLETEQIDQMYYMTVTLNQKLFEYYKLVPTRITEEEFRKIQKHYLKFLMSFSKRDIMVAGFQQALSELEIQFDYNEVQEVQELAAELARVHSEIKDG